MAKITIEAVKNEELQSAKGNTYTRCSVKTKDTSGKETWISGFGNNTTKSWTKGQVVELDIYKEEYQGKTYFKFREVVDRNIFVELDELKALIKDLTKITSQLFEVKGGNTPIDEVAKDFGGEVVPEEQINVEDIPF